MNNSVFAQAVNQAFPDLDQATKDKIISKMSAHILELLKEKVYVTDLESLASDNNLGDLDSQTYGQEIMKKFQSLPSDRQSAILKELDIEMTNKMHEIYNVIKR